MAKHLDVYKRQILELASKASSLAVSRKGASDSIPARAEVEACDLAPLG